MSTRSITPLTLVLDADRDLGRDDVRAERGLQRVERAVEVGALAVEHVDEQHPRDVALGGDLPQPLRRDLGAHHGVDHEDRRLADAQRAERVGDEARLPGRVEQVDLALVPLERAQRDRDRHLARLLVGLGVGGGGAVLDAAEAVQHAGLEQQRLVQRRLARPAVADERHVANRLRRCVPCLLLSWGGSQTYRLCPDGHGRGGCMHPRGRDGACAVPRVARMRGPAQALVR